MQIFNRLRTSLFAALLVTAPLLAGLWAAPQPAPASTTLNAQWLENAVAAAPCPVPFTFVNGTTAQAGQVNSNFSTLVGCFSSIYASDLVPTTAGQATFGGTINYTFPAGVIVQTGSANGVQSTGTGSFWLTSSTTTSNYDFTLSASNCTPGMLLVKGTAGQSWMDCGGDYLNSSNSEVSTFVQSGNGDFVSFSGPAEIVPNDQLSAELTVANNGNVISSGNVQAIPSPSTSPNASPAPVPPCYNTNGNPCSGTLHMIYYQVSWTTGTSCANNTLCTGAGDEETISFNPPFSGVSPSTYSCSGMMLTNGTIPTYIPSSASVVVLIVYNGSGSSISASTPLAASGTCTGI